MLRSGTVGQKPRAWFLITPQSCHVVGPAHRSAMHSIGSPLKFVNVRVGSFYDRCFLIPLSGKKIVEIGAWP